MIIIKNKKMFKKNQIIFLVLFINIIFFVFLNTTFALTWSTDIYTKNSQLLDALKVADNDYRKALAKSRNNKNNPNVIAAQKKLDEAKQAVNVSEKKVWTAVDEFNAKEYSDNYKDVGTISAEKALKQSEPNSTQSPSNNISDTSTTTKESSSNIKETSQTKDSANAYSQANETYKKANTDAYIARKRAESSSEAAKVAKKNAEDGRVEYANALWNYDKAVVDYNTAVDWGNTEEISKAEDKLFETNTKLDETLKESDRLDSIEKTAVDKAKEDTNTFENADKIAKKAKEKSDAAKGASEPSSWWASWNAWWWWSPAPTWWSTRKLWNSTIKNSLVWISENTVLPSEDNWLNLLQSIFIWVKESLTWLILLISVWVFLFIWIRLGLARWNPEEFKKGIIQLIYAVVWIFVVTLAWAAVTLVSWLNL